MKKIIVTGGTGMLGREICTRLKKKGYEVIVFSRSTAKGRTEASFADRLVQWDYHKPGSWSNELDGAHAVIHLAGANLFAKRWNDNYKKIILESRELSTRALVRSIAEAKNKPSVFISSSAIGIYGDRGDELLTESSDTGSDFLAMVCRAWEYEASKVEEFGVRRVSLRTGIVLDKDDGALKQMLTPFKMYVGGPLGNGKQWFPWIHIEDVIGIYLFALENNLTGSVNAVAPGIVTMNGFAKQLGKYLHKPSLFKVPRLVLRLALGEFADSILASINASSSKLLSAGYKFQFPELRSALANLIHA